MLHFLLAWAGAFAAIFAVFAVFGSQLDLWPLWLRALVLSGVMVALMQRALGPAIAMLLSRLERKA